MIDFMNLTNITFLLAFQVSDVWVATLAVSASWLALLLGIDWLKGGVCRHKVDESIRQTQSTWPLLRWIDHLMRNRC